MRPRDLPREHLNDLVPVVLAEHAVVALTPTTADVAWAAGAAWDLARAAAAKRRVALVDLALDAPALQREARDAPTEGIVDVFEFGASLNHIARPQGEGLFFLPVGTAPSDPRAVWGHERWARLQRGFQTEGALLLLYAPPGALRHLSLQPDGIVVLAPQGYDRSVAAIPALAAAVERGIPLLGTVCDEPAPVQPERPPAPTAGFGARTAPRAGSRRISIVGWIAAALVVIGGAAVIFHRHTPSAPAVAQAPAFEAAPPAPPPATPVASRPTPAPVKSSASADSLFYSVQVAAFNTLSQAMRYATRLSRRDRIATVTPVRLRRTVWYRVLVGTFATPSAAQTELATLRRGGTLNRAQGTVLRVAQAYRVGSYPTATAGARAAAGLRARGVPAYIVAGPNGLAQVLVGAFETPEQAHAADSLLAAARLHGTLIPRIGTSR